MNPISLASGVVPEFGPVDTIEAARAGGFDMVGLWVDPLEWTAAHTRDARAALAATGLPLLDVEVVWIKPDSVIDDHRKVIDVGAALGAANVLCVSSDPDHARTATHLAALCRHAEASGMRVALEFGIFTEVKDLAAAMAILDQVAHPLRALLIDQRLVHVDLRTLRVDLCAVCVHAGALAFDQRAVHPGVGGVLVEHHPVLRH